MKNPKLARLLNLDEQMQKLAEQRRLAAQDYKEYEQKARLRRIYKRGAFIESILPETVELTDAQVKTLLEQTLQSGYARKRIEEMMSEKPAAVKPKAVETGPADDDKDEETT